MQTRDRPRICTLEMSELADFTARGRMQAHTQGLRLGLHLRPRVSVDLRQGCSFNLQVNPAELLGSQVHRHFERAEEFSTSNHAWALFPTLSISVSFQGARRARGTGSHAWTPHGAPVSRSGQQVGIFTDAPNRVASEKPAPVPHGLLAPGWEGGLCRRGGGQAGRGWAEPAAAAGPHEVWVQQRPPKTGASSGETAAGPGPQQQFHHRLMSVCSPGTPMTSEPWGPL